MRPTYWERGILLGRYLTWRAPQLAWRSYVTKKKGVENFDAPIHGPSVS